MALDLSALDLQDEAGSPVSNGKALRAPLDMFVPDPEQLDRERDEAADDRDRADIKQRGVMQPIIVGEPLPDGRLPIRTGHRRWRLSGEAGLPDAPYLFEIDGVIYDDYAKLAENRKRKNDSPMDIAKLIVKRKALGEKNKYIADQIGIDPSEITHHLVLIEGPEYIRALYEQKKCRTPKYLYELEKLSREFPAEVESFCRTADEFSYKAIMAFGESLKNLGNTKESAAPDAAGNSSQTAAATSAPAASPAASSSSNQVGDTTPTHGDMNTSGDSSGAGDETTVWPFPTGSDSAGPKDDGEEPASAPAASEGDKAPTSRIPSHNPDIENDKTADAILADPSKIKKPLLLGTYNGSDVMVMLYKRPTTPGLVFVKHEDGTGEAEVEFGQITNLTLTESKV